MDALALLCTLHADGPATWRSLRENGCDSLAGLSRFQPDELSEILGGTTASAKRFLREARLLGERSGHSWLEREESAPSVHAAAPAAVALPELTEEVVLPMRDQQIVDDVLRAWREEDTKEFAQGVAAPEPAPAAPAPEPLVARGTALEPGLVDGLSESACERLHAEDVHTLEDLVDSDLGQIALHSGLGYSRLYRWRSLAERQLRSQLRTERAMDAQAPESFPEERLSPAEIPMLAPARDLLAIPGRAELPRRSVRWSPLEEGAAGPFA
ncbi:MAG: hypothetical protein IPJ19_08555 [Planctomycetes bacterium]|nr:hypothetical protein [Planctomycetota bacterium]